MDKLASGSLFIVIFVVAGLSGYGLYELINSDEGKNANDVSVKTSLSLHNKLTCGNANIALSTGLTHKDKLIWKKLASDVINLPGAALPKTGNKEQKMLPLSSLVQNKKGIKRIVLISCSLESVALDSNKEGKNVYSEHFLVKNRKHVLKLVKKGSQKALLRNIAEIRIF